MPTQEQARNLALRLHGLSGSAEILRKAVARELARHDPLDSNEFVGHLITLARSGWEPATHVLAAVTAALGMEAAQIPYADSLRRLAEVQSLGTVADLFAEGPARKQFDARAAAKSDAKVFSQSLGHLKQQARLTRDPDLLARLVTMSNASVVSNALLNPRLTEALVVRMAARRPARPEPLVEIWKSPRWSARHLVRRALVFNPYLPPEVGAKIVPLLNSTDLAELAHDTSVHLSLREQAARLLEEGVGKGQGRLGT
ncbi:hypothetical protein [Stigmatella aurantiaca]|uniref:Conserved uncharacterized protein n=1 Tax=Stigmatella aurantiaca (strain DW4/3-1) TaxID=378806 RepID=Q092K0_STIAD|nr:hypothetical protein [Stigmatella aurantiaca]ADO74240.1 conserved uncharacterized protein [Stigmatella aurantiaca DW4/3-1]EAU66636.1 hypothetical protein STIAU_7857 [Stigmatella aurantiaca DW4/3-1]